MIIVLCSALHNQIVGNSWYIGASIVRIPRRNNDFLVFVVLRRYQGVLGREIEEFGNTHAMNYYIVFLLYDTH